MLFTNFGNHFYNSKTYYNFTVYKNIQIMAKTRDQKKETKKSPAKSLKEKRAEKRSKKG